MQVLINSWGKKYKNCALIENTGSHYGYDKHNIKRSEIIINLKQILKHSIEYDVSIEHVFVQHNTHETIHKLLMENIDYDTCVAFDNIAGNEARKKHGNLALKYWSNGFYDRSV